ncbi:AimR family lysis-lysogeny pheromone receptor [Shouchella lonarensis]|uniref:Uncharacterized protein n=1 Tax=Shouchella lonarensis TaxID=1464122 RepID=A0A1G6LGC1_9BACI|nr:AimR family lysis-lysogeny pheromone receptor [Shouchella lonarensis]SDC42281.1 hypothetical protein SAMN05421737_108118 [Shouchella lonarensis]
MFILERMDERMMLTSAQQFIEEFTESTIKHKITKGTEGYLQRIGLWDHKEKWTKETMRHLALTREEGYHVPLLAFEQVLFVVKRFSSERLIPLMNEYSLAVENIDHIKDALEYAVQYRQEDLLVQLLDRHQDHPDLTEWVPVYQLLLVSVVRDCTSSEEIIDQARDLVGRVTETILKVRLEVHEVRSYVELGYRSKTAYLKEKLPKQLESVETSFVKSVLVTITNFYIAYDLVYNEGKLIEAEKYLQESVISHVVAETMCVPCYHLLSIATLARKDYTSVGYMQRALFYAERTGLEDYRQKLESEYLPFVRNMHGDKFDLDGVILEEQVHQYVVRLQYKKALELVTKLEADGNGSSFLTFYKGMALQDVGVLAEAMHAFAKEGRLYLLPLVEMELKKNSPS